jgi:S1-C subfamily serine protease
MDATKQFGDLIQPDRNLIPKLGILALDLDSRVAQMFPALRMGTGVVVVGHALDAPFREEGFLPGYIIHEVNRAAVKSLMDLGTHLAAVKAYDPVVFQIERNSNLFYFSFEFTP